MIDTSRLYYNGNSQGGILGGAATAVAPDWTRASLGVPAMNYSVLLNRSVDFDIYKPILDPAYPDQLDPAARAVADPDALGPQRAERLRASDDRQPAAEHAGARGADERRLRRPPGDHLAGRRRGAHDRRPIHDPVVYDGRWPGVDVALGHSEPIARYPFTGSAIVYWDSGPPRPDPGDPTEVIGTDPPPITNIPNRSGEDPHGDPRVAPGGDADGLRLPATRRASQITDTCAGPCYAGGFTGP